MADRASVETSSTGKILRGNRSRPRRGAGGRRRGAVSRSAREDVAEGIEPGGGVRRACWGTWTRRAMPEGWPPPPLRSRTPPLPTTGGPPWRGHSPSPAERVGGGTAGDAEGSGPAASVAGLLPEHRQLAVRCGRPLPDPDPRVGCENSVRHAATASYSRIRPPKRSRHFTAGTLSRGSIGGRGSGVDRPSDRWGLAVL